MTVIDLKKNNHGVPQGSILGFMANEFVCISMNLQNTLVSSLVGLHN